MLWGREGGAAVDVTLGVASSWPRCKHSSHIASWSPATHTHTHIHTHTHMHTPPLFYTFLYMRYFYMVIKNLPIHTLTCILVLLYTFIVLYTHAFIYSHTVFMGTCYLNAVYNNNYYNNNNNNNNNNNGNINNRHNNDNKKK